MSNDFGGHHFEESESGLFVPAPPNQPKMDSETHTPTPPSEPIIPSQNEVNLNDYEESLFRSTAYVDNKWKEDGVTTPPILTATRKIETTPVETSEVTQEPVLQQEQPVARTTEQEGDPYRKALNSVKNSDRTLIAEDQKRGELGESVSTIMTEDEAKNYNDRLQAIQQRSQYPNLSQFDKSLIRDDQLRRERGEGVSTIMTEDEAKNYNDRLQAMQQRSQYPNLSQFDKSLIRDDQLRRERGEGVSTIMTEEEAKRYEDAWKNINERTNPKEEVKNILREQESERQAEFAKAVHEERQAHDPTYKKELSPEEINSRIKVLEDKERSAPLTYEEYLEYRNLRLQRDSLVKESQAMLDAEREKQAKERKFKKWAIVAGVAGFGVAVIGGAYIGAVAATVTGLGALASRITDFAGGRRINALTNKMLTETNPEERAKLEKRIKTWSKIISIARKTAPILGAFSLGAGAGILVSNLFMGGRGLGEIMATKLQTPPSTGGEGFTGNTKVGEGVGKIAREAPTNLEGGNISTGESGTGRIELPQPIENLQTEGVLVRNGRVDLPGSAWNSNMGGAPVSGNELSSTSFAGGATNMGAFNLEQSLIGSGITRESLFANLNTGQIHSLLNTFKSNPSTTLVEALERIGTEGAKNLISIITG